MPRLSLYLFLITIISGLSFQHASGQDATRTPAAPLIAIQNPLPGQALQGLVTIQGDLNVPGFISAEVSFAYRGDPRGTWFLIAEIDRIPAEGLIAEWDTTALTDSDYDLRVQLHTDEGLVTVEILGVRVRNYSPVETDTPAPTASPAPQDTPVPTHTSTPTATPIPPTHTPLPPNPVQVTREEVLSSLGRGALIALGLFTLLGLYQALRRLGRRD